MFTDPDTFASANVQDPVFPLSEEAAEVLAAPDFNPVAVMSNRAGAGPRPDPRVHPRGLLEPPAEGAGAVHRGPQPRADRRRCWRPARPVEFVEAFAFPLPGETVFRLIGFPADDDELLKSWCVDRKAFQWGTPSPEQQRDDRRAHGRVLALLPRASPRPSATSRGDDLASELLAAHDAHPDELTLPRGRVDHLRPVVRRARSGHVADRQRPALPPAPARSVGRAVRRPGLDRQRGRGGAALRVEPGVVAAHHHASRPSLGGVRAAGGTQLLLNFAAANRQPDLFDQPDGSTSTGPTRRGTSPSARASTTASAPTWPSSKLRIVLQALASGSRRCGSSADQDVTHFPNITFRGPERLPSWTPSGPAGPMSLYQVQKFLYQLNRDQRAAGRVPRRPQRPTLADYRADRRGARARSWSPTSACCSTSASTARS